MWPLLRPLAPCNKKNLSPIVLSINLHHCNYAQNSTLVLDSRTFVLDHCPLTAICPFLYSSCLSLKPFYFAGALPGQESTIRQLQLQRRVSSRTVRQARKLALRDQLRPQKVLASEIYHCARVRMPIHRAECCVLFETFATTVEILDNRPKAARTA